MSRDEVWGNPKIYWKDVEETIEKIRNGQLLCECGFVRNI